MSCSGWTGLRLKKAGARAGARQGATRQRQHTSLDPVCPALAFASTDTARGSKPSQMVWLFSNEAQQSEPREVFLQPKQGYIMNSDLQRRKAYALTSCCCAALHTQPPSVAMHVRSPCKWLFILGSGAISGCEVVMSEIYKLLLTSKNAAFVILPAVSCRRIGTREMLPKNIIWRRFMFGS